MDDNLLASAAAAGMTQMVLLWAWQHANGVGGTEMASFDRGERADEMFIIMGGVFATTSLRLKFGDPAFFVLQAALAYFRMQRRKRLR